MTTAITEGSGNVFADIGLPEPDEHLVKAGLVHRIAAIIAAERLGPADAAQRLGFPQPEVTAMLDGHFQDHTVDRLMRFLVALGHNVEIVVRPVKPGTRAARITVPDLGE